MGIAWPTSSNDLHVWLKWYWSQHYMLLTEMPSRTITH